MGKISDIIQGLKPTLMMVSGQIISTGVTIFYKLANNYGISLDVLIAYRFIFAAAAVIPLALIIERKNRPKLTWKIVFQAFFSALFGGTMSQNLYAKSLVLTSATFVAALINLIPAMTFILAILFRLEGLRLMTVAGKAKVLGTLICIGGAMVLTFYNGCEINIWSTHVDLLHNNQQSGGHVASAHHTNSHKLLGPLLALACCLCVSFSIIIQAKISASYPCHYSSSALILLMGSIQAVVFALCTERDWSKWKLGWNFELLAIVYMGIIGTAMIRVFTMACIRMRGPLFVSVFSPLMLVLVALAGSLFLNEKLHLGSVLGAAIIVCGLYSVLWGKSKEIKKNTSFANANDQDEETIARESFKDFSHSNSVMAVAPNFITETSR